MGHADLLLHVSSRSSPPLTGDADGISCEGFVHSANEELLFPLGALSTDKVDTRFSLELGKVAFEEELLPVKHSSHSAIS